jgi:hypothetical protein
MISSRVNVKNFFGLIKKNLLQGFHIFLALGLE